MTYEQYIRYHLKGDAGVEERTIAKLYKRLGLSAWDSFRLIYYYTMTYNIPSALRLLLDANVKKADLKFRTDRRYVRCHGAYERLLAELTPDKLAALQACTTTSQAYETVSKWYYFGRYASYLLLEVYVNAFHPSWIDDIKYGWESNENYTRGAVLIVGCTDPKILDNFLEDAKRDTKDNAFAIETSLCAVAKFEKGTRWDGYYTERMLDEADKDPIYGQLIYSCV